MSKTTYGWQLDEEDEGDDSSAFPKFSKRKPYQQFETTFTAQQIHFYISEDIGEPREYTEMVHKITQAAPSDVIYIHLNTNGGHLETGVQLVNAMQNSQAKIVTVLESVAYSLGTLIFLAGDQMVVNDNCMMMFHNFRGGVIGKGNELTSQLDATVKWFSLFAKKIYVPFLSEDEFARLLRGEDIWMHSSDIRKRLDRMVKLSQEEAAAKANRKRKEDAPKDPPATP